MEPIRCALVGHGMIGREHARIIAAHPAAELVAVCDTDPDAGATVPEGTLFTTDLDVALGVEGLEALWVCTPPTLAPTGRRGWLGARPVRLLREAVRVLAGRR